MKNGFKLELDTTSDVPVVRAYNKSGDLGYYMAPKTTIKIAETLSNMSGNIIDEKV
jgi:hypothetical protein